MKLDWAIAFDSNRKVLTGLTEKEIRVILKLSDGELNQIHLFQLGWTRWKKASEVQFSEDDLFNPLACPVLPEGFQHK